MVKISGDFAELAKMGERLEEISGSSFIRTEVLTRLAEEARAQILLGFEQSRDPYGDPWRPPVGRPGGKPLLDTGRLRNSLTPRITGTGFTVSTDVIYAGTHQYGTTIKAKQAGKPLKFKIRGEWRAKYEVTIPKRQFMPEGTLGPIWTAAFNAEIDKLLTEWMA